MTPRDRGTIVQVGSALAYRAIPLQSAYCGAKFAIRGFTDSVRTELLHDRSGVWITMVQLPAVNTPQFNWCRTKLPNHPQPVPPIYQPEVPAEAVYWAAHHRRREITVGGSAVKAIVGQQARPTLRRLVPRTHRLRLAADPGHARCTAAPTTSSSRCPTERRRTACSTSAPPDAANRRGPRPIAG